MITGERLFSELEEIFKPISKKLKNECLNTVLRQMLIQNQIERISALDSIKELKKLQNQENKSYKTKEYPNGDRYEGYYVDDKKHGKGIYYFINGDQYEGDYVNDKKHGKGIYCFDNGDRYEGIFKDDKQDGNGIYCFDNGDRYEGDWKDGKLFDLNEEDKMSLQQKLSFRSCNIL